MSLDFTNRNEWLAIRASRPIRARIVWNQGTYSAGRTKAKEGIYARKIAARGATGCKAIAA